MNRREFLKLSATSAAAGMAGYATAKQAIPKWTGTDKVKVKLTAAKSANYKAAKAKTITLTVNVK